MIEFIQSARGYSKHLRLTPRFALAVRAQQLKLRDALAELRQSGLTLLWIASDRAGFGGGFRQFDADLSDPSIGLVA
jgi:hypothetical protein